MPTNADAHKKTQERKVSFAAGLDGNRVIGYGKNFLTGGGRGCFLVSLFPFFIDGDGLVRFRFLMD